MQRAQEWWFGLFPYFKSAQLLYCTERNDGTAGNIGIADGSVMQMSRGGLSNFIQNADFTTNRLAIP